MRFGSFTPIFPSRSPSSGLLITSRARICPLRQRSAAAVSTPSGAPPVPITACTPVPTTDTEIPAERSPSPISRMRAPAVRISSISFSWRGRSSTITTRSSTSRSSRLAMAFKLSATGASRSTAPLHDGSTTSFSMYRSGACSNPPRSLAASTAIERGGLLHAPDLYMEKLVVGPSCKGAVDLDAPVADNLKSIAKRLDRDVDDLVVIVLDRPRHEKLIEEIRTAGARIRLIGDGDLSAGISAAVIGTGVHAVMGTGGAPEGVLTAAALRCLNGQILARLVVSKPEHAERLAKMGVKDIKRVYDTQDLAPGKKMIFACTGVTDGNLLKGVRFFGEGVRTSSMILTLDERHVRFIDSVHLEKRPDIKVRFY